MLAELENRQWEKGVGSQSKEFPQRRKDVDWKIRYLIGIQQTEK